ncbi:MAG: carboxypeptidase-like regulatory domain-containing protein [Thermoplasmata archaeon]|nr:carboxypeptidase-like regulatory domain-containing protein [Thermoplasmata archaeon]
MAIAVALCLIVGFPGGTAGQARVAAVPHVLAIYQSNYTTEHDNFTVSLEVTNAADISYVYFTFCQLSSPLCYLPVFMTAHGTNWFVGTTHSMSSYHGMTVGVRAGYNITIEYANNSTLNEPAVPNPFSNLTIAQSVTGEYMFQMTVRNQLFALSGVVTDQATGAPLPGAMVTASPGNNSTATTGANGAYTIPGLLNGTYKLSVSDHGYRAANQTVVIAGQDLVENIPIANATPSASHTGTNSGASPFGKLSGSSPFLIGGVLVVIVALVALVVWRKRSDRSRPVAPEHDEPSESPPPKIE